jgi:hypothetical protein
VARPIEGASREEFADDSSLGASEPVLFPPVGQLVVGTGIPVGVGGRVLCKKVGVCVGFAVGRGSVAVACGVLVGMLLRFHQSLVFVLLLELGRANWPTGAGAKGSVIVRGCVGAAADEGGFVKGTGILGLKLGALVELLVELDVSLYSTGVTTGRCGLLSKGSSSLKTPLVLPPDDKEGLGGRVISRTGACVGGKVSSPGCA